MPITVWFLPVEVDLVVAEPLLVTLIGGPWRGAVTQRLKQRVSRKNRRFRKPPAVEVVDASLLDERERSKEVGGRALRRDGRAVGCEYRPLHLVRRTRSPARKNRVCASCRQLWVTEQGVEYCRSPVRRPRRSLPDSRARRLGCDERGAGLLRRVRDPRDRPGSARAWDDVHDRARKRGRRTAIHALAPVVGAAS